MLNMKDLVGVFNNTNFNYENIESNMKLKNINNTILSFSSVSFTNFDFIKYLSKSRLIDKDKTDEKLIKQQFGNFTNQNLICF